MICHALGSDLSAPGQFSRGTGGAELGHSFGNEGVMPEKITLELTIPPELGNTDDVI